MDILLAFLAFSAVMIVLSTMATVIVEAIHKLFRQRKKDFERMLTNYYLGAVKPLVKGAAEKGAKRFVDTIRRNPAFAGEHQKESQPSGNYFFDTAFEKLTTPQFVEQLARSNIGQNIGTQVQQGEAHLIDQLAAEFERYGDAAHDYFRRRAQVLSLFVAIGFAFVVNVDAVKLFQSMSADNESAKKIVAQIDPDTWEAKYMAAKKAGDNDAQKFEETIISARSNLQSDLDTVSKLDLPIGHAFFPFCADSGLLSDSLQQVNAASDNSHSNHIDARCNDFADGQSKDNKPQFLALLTNKNFWKWFFSTLLAGLLIGLGAPFWFKTYRFLADFVPGVNRGPTTQTREPANPSAPTQLHVRSNSTQTHSVDQPMAGIVPITLSGATNTASLNTSRLAALFQSASGVPISDSNKE